MGHICGASICLLARLLVTNTNFVHYISCQLLEKEINVGRLKPFENSFKTSGIIKLVIAIERIVNVRVPNVVEVIECNEFV